MYVNSTDNSIYIGSSTDAPLKIVTELNIESYVKEYAGSGGLGEPELPDKDSLTLGNNITWADQQWIVSHVTSTEAYLTLKGLFGECSWNNLQSACMNFAQSLTEAQKACLRSVTADSTSGKVFVATYDQMNGRFSYFNSDSRRRVSDVYWTSTEYDSSRAWFVGSSGSFDYYNGTKPYPIGFRPSVCIDLTLYNT